MEWIDQQPVQLRYEYHERLMNMFNAWSDDVLDGTQLIYERMYKAGYWKEFLSASEFDERWAAVRRGLSAQGRTQISTAEIDLPDRS